MRKELVDMPIYEYECCKCGKTTEAMQKIFRSTSYTVRPVSRPAPEAHFREHFSPQGFRLVYNRLCRQEPEHRKACGEQNSRQQSGNEREENRERIFDKGFIGKGFLINNRAFFRKLERAPARFFICGAAMHYPEIPGGRLARLIWQSAAGPGAGFPWRKN